MDLTRRSLSALALGALSVPAEKRVRAEENSLAVVELFTSQGCSSCPPADALMLDLARHPTTVAITFPVEIWDYLGWKDTLAQPSFTRRQRAYAATVAGKRVYTPQAIVNGKGHCVGSDGLAISRLRLSPPANVARIGLSRSGDGWAYQIALAQIPAEARLVLVPVVSRHTVQIGRGENSGRQITYANVARALIDLGPVTAATIRGQIVDTDLAVGGADAFALLVQAGSLEAPGVIHGGAFVGAGGVKA